MTGFTAVVSVLWLAKESLPELLFFNERRLRTSLRPLVRDPKVGARACEILAFIGAPEDLSFILQSPPPPEGGGGGAGGPDRLSTIGKVSVAI